MSEYCLVRSRLRQLACLVPVLGLPVGRPEVLLVAAARRRPSISKPPATSKRRP